MQKDSSGFRKHAGRIMAVYDQAVSSLSNDDYESELKKLWDEVGESHNRRKISQQAMKVNISIFSFSYLCFSFFFCWKKKKKKKKK